MWPPLSHLQTDRQEEEEKEEEKEEEEMLLPIPISLPSECFHFRPGFSPPTTGDSQATGRQKWEMMW